MPTYFCNSDKCGAAITYSVTKPNVCPKCGKELKVAITASIKAIVPTSQLYQVVPPDDEDLEPLVAPTRQTQSKHLSRARIMEEYKPDDPSNEEDDLDSSEEEDDVLDKRAARKLARQLIAKIDPDTIHISGDDGDKPIKFGDLVKQREVEQQ